MPTTEFVKPMPNSGDDDSPLKTYQYHKVLNEYNMLNSIFKSVSVSIQVIIKLEILFTPIVMQLKTKNLVARSFKGSFEDNRKNG